MGRVDPQKIRNVALLGHSHDGKTMLAEAMLFAGGSIERLGKPEAGNTTLDFEPEEIKRKISIGTAVAHVTWRDHKINLLDTPGFQDFVGEVIGALHAAEGALLVVGASAGAVVGTELAWQQLRARRLPTLLVVNKMDKENADFWKALDSMREFSPRPVAIQAPIGLEAGFKGVVDLLARKAYEFDAQGRPKEVPVPADFKGELEQRRYALVEAAAETDDALLERYLESGELSDADVTAALAKGVASGDIVPAVCTAAARSIGVGTLLDAIVDLLPSAATYQVGAVSPRTYSAAVTAKTKADEEKVNAALVKLVDEDPTLSLVHEPSTKETVLQGVGDVHLDVVLEKLKRKYGVEAALQVPRVPYQETITGSARAEKKYKKQSGGAGLYGHCVIEIAPVPRGTGFVWEDKIFGGSIPHNFRPSVEKGVKETMEQGVLTGNPLVDIKVRLVDGSTHAVDGKDIAFKLAGAMAMRQAVMDAKPVLLEPIMDVEVLVPERNMGDVVSDLNGKRGKIAGMEPSGDHLTSVKAQVPLSSMYRFPIDLRSITQGRGRYKMKFSHYEEVPAHAAQPIISAYQKARSGEEEE